MTYLTKETIISCVISSFFSVLFFYIFFNGVSDITFGSVNKFTMDFIPQGFFLGLFSTLPPSLTTWRRLKKGDIVAGDDVSTLLPGNLFLRVLAAAIFSLLVLGGSIAIISAMILPEFTIGFYAAIVVKILFSILVAIVITPLAIKTTYAKFNKVQAA